MVDVSKVDEIVQGTASIAVIVPVYNGERDLPGLLDCLESQRYPSDRVRYFLIDNNSRDRTSEQLQAAVSHFQSLGLSLYALSEQSIQSSYAARNAGIQAAVNAARATRPDRQEEAQAKPPKANDALPDEPYEVVAFTDADCRPHPDWLTKLTEPFFDAQVGVVAGAILPLESKTWLERYAARREFLSQRHTLAHPFRAYGQTANLAVRRSVLTQVGLFRPYLNSGGDADLCWRILQEGQWQIRFAEQAIVYHRHRNSLSALWEQWQRYGRSDAYLHELHGSPLMRSLTLRDYQTRVARWLVKELPLTLRAMTRQQAVWDQLFDTPLDILCAAARAQGQQRSSLPTSATTIAWLPDSE